MGLMQRLEMRQGQSLVDDAAAPAGDQALQLSHLDLVAYVEAELERNPLLDTRAGSTAPADAPGLPSHRRLSCAPNQPGGARARSRRIGAGPASVRRRGRPRGRASPPRRGSRRLAGLRRATEPDLEATLAQRRASPSISRPARSRDADPRPAADRPPPHPRLDEAGYLAEALAEIAARLGRSRGGGRRCARA